MELEHYGILKNAFLPMEITTRGYGYHGIIFDQINPMGYINLKVRQFRAQLQSQSQPISRIDYM